MKEIVCLTGGMGSGKSTVARLLLEEGFAVYDSDDRAKALMLEPAVREEVETIFGSSAYAEDGSLNRSFLSQQIFSYPNRKVQLEAIIHPAVRTDFNLWLEQAKGKVVFKESALSIELGDPTCHSILVVHCPENIRIQRIKNRNPEWSIAEISARLASQLTDEQRLMSGAQLLDNSSTFAALKVSLHQALTKWI
ncbi:MAG: dephospho-CoA kinase [Bacteroidetes bacterium]|nr:dephospho-CoA kinase [Bacteroidota bacterium]